MATAFQQPSEKRSTAWSSFRLQLAIAVVIAGCAMTGPRFSEDSASTTGVPLDTVHLIVFNIHDKVYPPPYDIPSMQIAIDGCDNSEIAIGSFRMLTLPPGRHRLAAHYPWWTGRCEVVVDLEGGKRYFAEVSPWMDFSRPSEEPAASRSYSGFNLFALLPLGELAIWQSNPCGGLTITLEDEATALPKVANLRSWR